jgi:hypothetical protein
MAERLRDEDRGIRLEADLKASAAVTKQAGLTWPMPADRRLDQLVELANEMGAGTRRNELAAAIVAAAEADGEVLLRLVLQWRRSKVRDVIVNPPQEASVIHFPRYGPGRRKADTTSLLPGTRTSAFLMQGSGLSRGTGGHGSLRFGDLPRRHSCCLYFGTDW